jgi:hypothetical protein
MKYIIRNAGVLGILILFAITLSLAPSCKKTGESVAVITVLDSLGKPVQGALVKLTASPQALKTIAPYLPSIQTSGADGKTYHRLPLEAVLNAEVSKGNLKVNDMVRFKKDDTIYQTIVLK